MRRSPHAAACPSRTQGEADERPRAQRGAEQSRSVLDAVHRQPAVQDQPAHVRRAPRTCTTRTADGRAGARRHGRAVVRAMPATAGRRSSRRSQKQAAELDYAPAFQMGHPKAFELASRLVALTPTGLDHVFFTNSGSESVETALKIALAYQRVTRRGQPLPPDRPRARLSRRQFRRHLGRRHRRQPQDVRHAADRRRPHPPHPRPVRATPSRAAQPEHGAELADDLERLVALHDRLDHRRGDRRAGRRLDRRAHPAEGLSREAARDLRQARHPADLRRGDHRLRPPRHAFRRRLFRRHAGHDRPPPRASPTASSRWAPCSSRTRSTTPS